MTPEQAIEVVTTAYENNLSMGEAIERVKAKPVEPDPDPNLIPNPERNKRLPILHQREATAPGGDTAGWPAPPPPPAENLGPWTGGTVRENRWRPNQAWEAAERMVHEQQVRTTGTPINILRQLYRQLNEVIIAMDRNGQGHHISRGVADGEFLIGDFLITSLWQGRVGGPRTQETEAQREALYRANGTMAINAAAPYDYAALQETLSRAADATFRPLNDPDPGTPF